jgi:uncharacterized protein YraI
MRCLSMYCSAPILRPFVIAFILSITVAASVDAQQQATVKRTVNLRTTPSNAQTEIRTLNRLKW